jgi:DNA repair protein RecO (recombination protein O)
MRWFEMNLLSVAGFQPELFNCLECGAELTPVVNFLCLTEGGVFCPACGARRNDVEPLDVDTLKVMRYIQNNSWITLATLKVRVPVMRRVESVLERQLRSTDFLRRLQHLPSPGE